MLLSDERIRKAREAGQRTLETLKKGGIIPQVAAKQTVKWSDPETSIEQKLEHLLREIANLKAANEPLPNPFNATPTPLDDFIADKEAELKKQKEEELYKRIKELERRRDESDESFRKLVGHINNTIAVKVASLEKEAKRRWWW
jgi:hypothetical protein